MTISPTLGADQKFRDRGTRVRAPSIRPPGGQIPPLRAVTPPPRSAERLFPPVGEHGRLLHDSRKCGPYLGNAVIRRMVHRSPNVLIISRGRLRAVIEPPACPLRTRSSCDAGVARRRPPVRLATPQRRKTRKDGGPRQGARGWNQISSSAKRGTRRGGPLLDLANGGESRGRICYPSGVL